MSHKAARSYSHSLDSHSERGTGEEDRDQHVPVQTYSAPDNGGLRPLSWLFGLSPRSESHPLPPSQDPWYKAPPGFESRQPGDILRIRPATNNLIDSVSNASAAYHILYRTTDSRYKPSWAVTTLFTPHHVYSSPSGRAALLSYQFAYNTANLDSCPSFGLYGRLFKDGNTDIGTKSNTSFIGNLLAQGWVVNTPDHLGPNSAFGASVQSGHATLDSIRAVHNLGQLTGASEFITAMWGYSGGSIATLAASELQPRYAPDLELAGAVLGGLVDDISADFDRINKSILASTLVAVLLGLTVQYPEAKEYLESQLVPETKDEFLSVRDINLADSVKLFAQRDIYGYFKGGAADLQAPILRRLYNSQAKLGFKGVPTMPMFVYKAIGDQYVPIEQTDITVSRLCNGGANIRYERNTVGEHVSEIENGKPRAMKWLRNIFDESYEAPISGCDIKDVTVDISTESA
ncbi:secretory lipase-domain-containing protein [Mariannaea sp. PMI_226]|nr:secretory lipase-domain-containing protein [Mariannaea sp. PMI_226]